ncbi:hypothetical protein HLB23_18770 [Nocardia uniformis]|uniref:Uncharacterized protein n=1 Tax=Nocardia uniformis TaxID=53432 RepID=A0A849C6A6_9NOCA|nr:hypothetical protein [Nocardia uniformis]NNH71875.1 hypothetical protein [Nocardia uniformis]
MRFLFNRFTAAALGLLMVGLSVSCGNAGSTLDYGPYPTHRIDGDYDDQPSRARGILAESLRLGERVVQASDIDPDLTVGRGGGPLADHHGVIAGVLSGPQGVALEKFDVVAGFSALAASKPYADGNRQEKFLAVSLIAFPDDQTAAAAARDMAREDFETVEQNTPVTLDGYPQALNHWQPGVPTVGSWLAWKSLVIRILAQLPEPDLDRLTDMVARTYQLQLAELESFTATSVGDIPTLPLDPDKLLPRLVKTGDYAPDDYTFAIYGPRAFAVMIDNPAAEIQEFEARGVTAVGVSHNKFLYRTRDSAAAAGLSVYLDGKRGQSEYVPMRGVRNLPSVTCSQATVPSPSLEARRFRCIVVRGDLVAQLYSNQETNIRWMAAAQYAVMADAR